MSRFFMILVVVLGVAACKMPEPRKPVSQSSGSYIDASVARNKEMNKAEEAAILQIINQDTTQHYIASNSGFWYTYEVKSDSAFAKAPQTGDLVKFNYNLASIDGQEIVSSATLGTQTYQIDQSNQELLPGLRDGIKLMKEGETLTFLFPSHRAFGYYGYKDIIGRNRPMRSTVTLQSIEPKKEDQ